MKDNLNADLSAGSALQSMYILCELLQRAHFTARDLQQHVPVTDRESLADQLHRIRTLAVQLKMQLAETQEA